jgi:hypothetical protein
MRQLVKSDHLATKRPETLKRNQLISFVATFHLFGVSFEKKLLAFYLQFFFVLA